MLLFNNITWHEHGFILAKTSCESGACELRTGTGMHVIEYQKSVIKYCVIFTSRVQRSQRAKSSHSLIVIKVHVSVNAVE